MSFDNFLTSMSFKLRSNSLLGNKGIPSPIITDSTFMITSSIKFSLAKDEFNPEPPVINMLLNPFKISKASFGFEANTYPSPNL